MATGLVQGTLVAEGLGGVQRAFARAGKEVSKDLRKTLREAAEPVRVDAEALALSGIRNMPGSPQWAQMRIGVTRKAVYMVPKQRGQKGRDQRLRRPKMAGLLLNRSMIPAVQRNQARVEADVHDMLVKLAHRWAVTP